MPTRQELSMSRETAGIAMEARSHREQDERVDEATVAALTEALQDEYKARATYRKVIETFGPVRPFVNIIEAENRHADALLRQFDRLGVKPPKDEWAGRISAPSSIATACEAARAAEIDNDAMYSRFLKTVDDTIVRAVFCNLRDATRNRHLPALYRCQKRSRNTETIA